MTVELKADIVIVGAGPAGAMTGLLGGQRRPDLKILLLDAAPRAQAKPCGEFLSPDGLRILEKAGVETLVMATGAHPLSGLRMASHRGSLRAEFQPFLGRSPLRPYGIGVRRERFDDVLQTAAAQLIELRRDARLVGMERSGNGWRLRVRERAQEILLWARMVIGADGRLSQVRRLAGLDRPSERKRFALVCRARGIPHGAEVEMHLGPIGQIGLAPLGDGEVNLNLLIADASRELLRSLSPGQLMRAALRATSSLRERSHDAHLGRILATGSLPQESSAVIADGLALVGDAAGFCDPFTGEGICLALQGAESLAETLATLTAKTAVPTAALLPYARAYRRRFGWRRSLGEQLQWLLRHRGLSEHLVAMLGRSPIISRALAAMNGGYLLPK